jgi:hypothetical protein
VKLHDATARPPQIKTSYKSTLLEIELYIKLTTLKATKPITMPPKKAKQTASNRSSGDAPAPKPIATQAQTPPQNDPPRHNAAVGITQAQKQALVDNLQLEG